MKVYDRWHEINVSRHKHQIRFWLSLDLNLSLEEAAEKANRDSSFTSEVREDALNEIRRDIKELHG